MDNRGLVKSSVGGIAESLQILSLHREQHIFVEDIHETEEELEAVAKSNCFPFFTVLMSYFRGKTVVVRINIFMLSNC
jgi:hypothetical protein